MFALKRNQIIITALVVMVAVAGYLNYTDDKSNTLPSIALSDEGEVIALVPDSLDGEVIPVTSTTVDSNWEIGDALTFDESPEIASEYDETATMEETEEPGTAVFVNASDDSGYFVQAKLEREQARAKQKEILTGMINNENVEQTQRAECAEAMLEIQKRIEKETAAEAMIEAKGFSEVYVRIDDDTVDVVVNKEALSDAEIAQIEDIVKRKTGMETDQIRISPMKK